MNPLSPALAVLRAIAQLLDAVTSLASDVRTIRIGLEPVQDEVAILQEEIVIIRTGLEPVQDHIEAMRRDLAAVKADSSVLRREIDGLTDQLDEVLRRLPDLKPGDDEGLVTKARDALKGAA